MKTNWWKWTFLACIAAVLFFLGRCSIGKAKNTPNPGRTDTVFTEVTVIDTHYIPQPYEVVKSGGVKVRREIVTVTDTIEVPVIVEVSEGTAYYRDSLPVSHGYAIIQDTVAGNRITGRNFRLNQSLPVVKETVAEKKRNVVYLGLNAQGSKQNFFYSIGADVSLKAKNDRIYSLGVGVTKDNQLLYGAGFRWPVRLRK